MAFAPLKNETYNNYFILAKNEMDSWYFINQKWLVPSILGGYATLLVADKIFKDRRPLNLKSWMMVFNLYQICSNAYMAYLGLLPDSINYLVNHSCHPKDPAENQLWLRGTTLGQLFFVSKLTDLLDTVFIVLRKKKSQISFLHLYHHMGMVIYPWIILQYFISEQLIVIIIVNSLVHVVMYTYYSLTLLGPTVRKYLWWKEYVTLLQLAQFALFMVHATILLANGCPQPKGMSLFILLQAMIFFQLFKNFYNETYGKSFKVSVNQIEAKQK